MATIQSRVRFLGKISGKGSILKSKGFSKEAQARQWIREQEKSLVSEGAEKDDFKTNVSQRSTYRAMIRIKGHPLESATFARKTDARRWAEKTESAIRDGQYFVSSRARRTTLKDLLEKYQVEVLSKKPAKRRLDQERHIKWWNEQLGPFSLVEITSDLISGKKMLLSSGTTVRNRKRSPGTVNRYLSTLGRAFSLAAGEWRLMQQNPMQHVAKMEEPKGRVRFLSDGERRRLLDACRKSFDSRLQVLVTLALATGARRGELLRLRWPDVDLTRGTVTFHDTKNRESRSVPIMGHALELLTKFRSVRRLDTDLVFADAEGRPTFPRRAWETALKQAGIERDPEPEFRKRLREENPNLADELDAFSKGGDSEMASDELEAIRRELIRHCGFRYHDLRHSAATYLASSGASIGDISRILGHRNIQTTMIYAHLTEQYTRQVVAEMNEQIFGSQ